MDVINRIQKMLPVGLGVNSIYKAKSGYIISTYLLNEPDAILNDNLFILNFDGTIEECPSSLYSEELHDAFSKKENNIYYRK